MPQNKFLSGASLGSSFLLIACLFYFSSRFSEEMSRNRIKTKEIALQKVLTAMRKDNWEALEKIASTEALQDLNERKNGTEFKRTTLSKLVPKWRELSAPKLWQHWAEGIPAKPVPRWEKWPMINAECHVAGFPKRGAHLRFCNSGQGWLLDGIILTADE